jgi:hypothetical protein
VVVKKRKVGEDDENNGEDRWDATRREGWEEEAKEADRKEPPRKKTGPAFTITLDGFNPPVSAAAEPPRKKVLTMPGTEGTPVGGAVAAMTGVTVAGAPKYVVKNSSNVGETEALKNMVESLKSMVEGLASGGGRGGYGGYDGGYGGGYRGRGRGAPVAYRGRGAAFAPRGRGALVARGRGAPVARGRGAPAARGRGRGGSTVYHSDAVCRFDTKCNNMSCAYQHPQRAKAEIEFLGEGKASTAAQASAAAVPAEVEAKAAAVAESV